MGKYRCFFKEQWETGLPLLAQSSDEALSGASKMDLASPKDPAEQLRVADQWWDLAEAQQGTEQSALRRHAAYWYGQAVRKLNGLAREKAEKRAAYLSTAEQKDSPSEVHRAAEPTAANAKPADAAASVEHDAQKLPDRQGCPISVQAFLGR